MGTPSPWRGSRAATRGTRAATTPSAAKGLGRGSAATRSAVATSSRLRPLDCALDRLPEAVLERYAQPPPPEQGNRRRGGFDVEHDPAAASEAAAKPPTKAAWPRPAEGRDGRRGHRPRPAPTIIAAGAGCSLELKAYPVSTSEPNSPPLEPGQAGEILPLTLRLTDGQSDAWLRYAADVATLRCPGGRTARAWCCGHPDRRSGDREAIHVPGGQLRIRGRRTRSQGRSPMP